MPESNLVEVHRLAPLGKPPANEILWSPVDQDKILVSSGYANFSGGENYILNTETGEKQVLARAEYGSLEIRTWLPDGNSIIMAADPETIGFEQGGLWEVSLDGNQFTYFQTKMDKIVWGPDRKSFTVERTRMTEAGQAKTELVWIDRITSKEIVIFEAKPGQTIFGFSWSADGKQLVFSMGSVQPMGNFNIYLLDTYSGKVKQITNEGDNTDPVWSPVTDLIAYRKKTYDRNKDVFSLHLIDPNGSCDIKLLDSDYLLPPTWSPDGNLLAFIDPSVNGIFVANLHELVGDNYGRWCP